MIDLVRYEAESIESRFLEPACGTGNFLVPILERKMARVKRDYRRSQFEFERNAVIAVGSIYGIDLLSDNVEACRGRLFYVFDSVYLSLYKGRCKEPIRDAVRFILGKNIITGNALTLKTEGNHPESIIFSHWSPLHGKIKRRDYFFEELIPKDETSDSLFATKQLSDEGNPIFLPKSIRSFPLVSILRLAYESN